MGENLRPSVLNSQVQRCPVTIYRIYRLPGREEFRADHDLSIRRAGPPRREHLSSYIRDER